MNNTPITLPCKLYFNKIAVGGLQAQTDSEEHIIHNLTVIGNGWVQVYMDMLVKKSTGTLFITAGKYLVLLIVEKEKTGMLIFDFKNSRALAEAQAACCGVHAEQLLEAWNTIYYYDANIELYILVQRKKTGLALQYN